MAKTKRTALDPEVVSLCAAINRVQGLQTYASCCGHGKHSLDVWVRVAELQALYPLLRAIDCRYGGPLSVDGTWTCEAMSTDLTAKGRSVVFFLHSQSTGNQAYEEAEQVAQNLDRILADKAVCKAFGVVPVSV